VSVNKYNEALALSVCKRLEDEPHLGLSEILRQAGIARTTFRDWRAAHPELDAAYKDAKEVGYEALAQQCLGIADDRTDDYVDTEAGPMLNREHVQRSKVRIDTRLKLLAKWYPERYGERLAVDHGVQSNLAERLKAARERSRSD
jgi:hypothetical protein